MEEQVVLVNEQNVEVGTAPKAAVHTKKTPLHRGFSAFIFNPKGQLLVTKRALTKKTFAGIWSNTVCGHPAPNEGNVEAVERRLLEELGIRAESIDKVADYRYCFPDINGIVENEICPVFLGYCERDPNANPVEIAEWKWMGWQEFLEAIDTHPDEFSPWCREEALFVEKALHMNTVKGTYEEK